MPSASMAFMSAVFAMTTLWPMMFLASLPVCLRLMVNVLQLLLMSMFATLYFIASLPSMSTEQVAANAEGASASSAAVTRNLRIMGRTSRGGSVGSRPRSEEHTSELQSLMRISYAVFCLKKKKKYNGITKQEVIYND